VPAKFDQLVRKLRDLFGLTIVMITHDLDLLWQVADRVAVLADGKVQGIGSMAELSQLDHPAIRKFFAGPRGRAAQEQISPQRQQTPTGRTHTGGHHRNQSELCTGRRFVFCSAWR
jgi:phospholipid/cholesterol/gamma-HCH transport system ATP-binding protein